MYLKVQRLMAVLYFTSAEFKFQTASPVPDTLPNKMQRRLPMLFHHKC